MKKNLPLFFAGRYLFAKKSHNVINVISAISAIGMAIGTAALVIILSVYNGFDALIEDNLSESSPDLLIAPEKGKVFIPSDGLLKGIEGIEGVASVTYHLSETVFANYEGRQAVALLRGIPDDYADKTDLYPRIRSGEYSLRFGEMARCIVGGEIARELGVNPAFLASISFYFPDREKQISLQNPATVLCAVSARPSCVLYPGNEGEGNVVYVPIAKVRELLKYTKELTALEVRYEEGTSSRSAKAVEKQVRTFVREAGAELTILDRYRQNEALYKMMRYEKAAIFLILIFVIIIIAFNIFGSLSMLIIEKKGDIATLKSMGAPEKMVREIFVLEGWLISLLGMAIGLVAGIGLSLLQQKAGLIKIPGNYIVDSYPVVIQWLDLILIAAGVAVVGYLVALLPVNKKNISYE